MSRVVAILPSWTESWPGRVLSVRETQALALLREKKSAMNAA